MIRQFVVSDTWEHSIAELSELVRDLQLEVWGRVCHSVLGRRRTIGHPVHSSVERWFRRYKKDAAGHPRQLIWSLRSAPGPVSII